MLERRDAPASRSGSPVTLERGLILGPKAVDIVAGVLVEARLEEGLEGLVHVSEMDLNNTTVRDTYTDGQKINVRILHLDPQHQRLGLSLKLDGN